MRWLLTCLPLLTACSDLALGGVVTGVVLGSDFEGIGGSADGINDRYTITLSDSDAFACLGNVEPPDFYLTVVVDDVIEPTTLPAAGVVTFNRVDDGVLVAEAAVSGEVVVDVLDPVYGRISGRIDATGPSSDVTGSFDVEICP